MPALKKADLLAKISQLEGELGLSNAECSRLQRELDAEYVAQRPSRAARSSQDFVSTVRVERRGQCTVKRWSAA